MHSPIGDGRRLILVPGALLCGRVSLPCRIPRSPQALFPDEAANWHSPFFCRALAPIAHWHCHRGPFGLWPFPKLEVRHRLRTPPEESGRRALRLRGAGHSPGFPCHVRLGEKLVRVPIGQVWFRSRSSVYNSCRSRKGKDDRALSICSRFVIPGSNDAPGARPCAKLGWSCPCVGDASGPSAVLTLSHEETGSLAWLLQFFSSDVLGPQALTACPGMVPHRGSVQFMRQSQTTLHRSGHIAVDDPARLTAAVSASPCKRNENADFRSRLRAAMPAAVLPDQPLPLDAT